MKVTLTNSKHLDISATISDFLNLGKSNSMIVEDSKTKKVNKIDIPAVIKIPSKLSYSLLKNKSSRLSVIEKLRDDIITELREDFKKNENFDENKYQSDKKYQDEIDKNLTEYVTNSEVYKDFLEEESEVDYFSTTISFSETIEGGNINLDKFPDFDPVYIPEILIGTVILFEE